MAKSKTQAPPPLPKEGSTESKKSTPKSNSVPSTDACGHLDAQLERRLQNSPLPESVCHALGVAAEAVCAAIEDGAQKDVFRTTMILAIDTASQAQQKRVTT